MLKQISRQGLTRRQLVVRASRSYRNCGNGFASHLNDCVGCKTDLAESLQQFLRIPVDQVLGIGHSLLQPVQQPRAQRSAIGSALRELVSVPRVHYASTSLEQSDCTCKQSGSSQLLSVDIQTVLNLPAVANFTIARRSDLTI